MKYIKIYEDIEWKYEMEEEEPIKKDITNCYIAYDTKEECIDIMDKLVRLGYDVYDYGKYNDYYMWNGFVYETDKWTQTSAKPDDYSELILIYYDDINNYY